MRKALGILILASVFGGPFLLTADAGGWKLAAQIWGAALGLAALLVLGLVLAVES